MVFMVMPEVGPASEPGELRRLGRGLAYVALRTGAPVVPLILGGNHELYLGRRIVLRVLPALDAPEPRATPGSTAERAAARRLTEAFAAHVRTAVMEAHAAAEPSPGTPTRGRFLTTLFR